MVSSPAVLSRAPDARPDQPHGSRLPHPDALITWLPGRPPVVGADGHGHAYRQRHLSRLG
jgi:hypothetical protein